MATITINGTLVNDQTLGVQDDDDAISNTLAGLTAAFVTFLNNLPTGVNAPLTTSQKDFAGAVEAAISGTGFVTVNPQGSTVSDLFFSDASGNALNGDQVFISGSTPLQTVGGQNIYLWSFGNFALATTGNTEANKGDVVAAFYLNEAANHLSASIETVTFIPIAHPDATNHDDRIDWTSLLNVAAATSVDFSFAGAPSGSNLFMTFGNPNSVQIVVIGQDPLNQSQGGNINTKDVLNISQAGSTTSFGVNGNQINPDEGAFITYVTGANTNFLVPNLNQNEADVEANIAFQNVFNTTGASFTVNQTNPPVGPVTVKISAFTTAAESGVNFVDGLTNDTPVIITSASVVNNNGGQTPVISISGGVLTVSGLNGGDQVLWTTSTNHNRVLIENISNADGIAGNDNNTFDIGGFGLTQGAVVTTSVGDKLSVDDDGPTVSANLTAQLDDDALTGGNSGGIGDDPNAVNLSGTLGHAFGTDGAGSIAFLATGAPTGFTYELSGSDLLIKQGTTTVVTVTLNTATGAYTVTQNNPILHAAGLDENNVAFTLNYQVTDKDGDTANGTLGINVDDDTPIIGPISNGLVDFAAGDSDTKSLNGSVGADGGATYSITSSPATVTIFDGTSAQLTLLRDISPDSTVINYFQDNDSSGTRTAGDTDFFRLALSGGNYTFEVLQDPPPATLEFDFDDLPSGANLFGVVGTTSTEPAIIVIGENIELKADNTYGNKSDTIHTSQGGEGATIGLNNQLLDNVGEGIYFTYVDDPVQNFLSGAPGGLTATEANDADNIQYKGGTLEVGTASFTISQMQGNDLAAVTINAYDILDAPQGVDFVKSLGTGAARPIDDVRVFDETGTLIETFDGTVNDPNVEIKIDGSGVATVSGLDAGYTVEWDTVGLHDRVLIQNAGGQFDIGRFLISQPQPTPDEKLDFTVQIADADGDKAAASFSVGIDGTGVFDDGVITV